MTNEEVCRTEAIKLSVALAPLNHKYHTIYGVLTNAEHIEEYIKNGTICNEEGNN